MRLVYIILYQVVYSEKLFFNVYLFFREKEEREQAGKRQREKETQNPKQGPVSELSAQSRTWGLNS